MRNVQTRPGPATARAYAPRDSLEVYCRDVAAQGLLTADDEVRLAREIEALDIRAWELAFSYPAAVGYVVDVLERCIENALRGFRSLRRAAAAARRTRRKAERDRLSKAAHRVAAELRKLDLDRRYRDAVVAELRRCARGDRTGAGPARLPFVPRSHGFGRYLARIEEAVASADRLRARFVEANLRLVLAVARRYDLGAMPFSDLVQEGNLGLMKAVDRFDYSRGLRFSTYATWWIRHNVGRAIAEKARTIRLPVHVVETRQRLARIEQSLSASLGRRATTDELASAAQVSASKIEDLAGQVPQYGMSLDQPVSGDVERPRLEVFRDPHLDQPTPFDALASKRRARLVERLVSELRPVEADVVRQRYGLDGDSERTLQDIATQYGLSRERIRQIQADALAKLRRSMRRLERVPGRITPQVSETRT